MKDRAVIFGAVGVVLIAAVMLRKKKVAATGGAPAYVQTIANPAQQGQPGFGWEYFTNGGAIGPDGAYYKNGVKIWEPPGALQKQSYDGDSGQGGMEWF